MAVVISLNRFLAPVDDTVTAHSKTQVTSHNPVGVAIRSTEDHSDEKITHHEAGWSPVRNHPVYVRGGQVSDWEESQVLAALAVSELSAALQ